MWGRKLNCDLLGRRRAERRIERGGKLELVTKGYIGRLGVESGLLDKIRCGGNKYRGWHIAWSGVRRIDIHHCMKFLNTCIQPGIILETKTPPYPPHFPKIFHIPPTKTKKANHQATTHHQVLTQAAFHNHHHTHTHKVSHTVLADEYTSH